MKLSFLGIKISSFSLEVITWLNIGSSDDIDELIFFLLLEFATLINFANQSSSSVNLLLFALSFSFLFSVPLLVIPLLSFILPSTLDFFHYCCYFLYYLNHRYFHLYYLNHLVYLIFCPHFPHYDYYLHH